MKYESVNKVRKNIGPDNGDIQEGQQILKDKGLLSKEKYVVINPGGNWLMKRWSTESFAKLGDMLTQNNKLKVIIAGAKKDIGLSENIASMMRIQPIMITGSTTLHQLAAIMKAACCVVSADSGPMHIAAANTTKNMTNPILYLQILFGVHL